MDLNRFNLHKITFVLANLINQLHKFIYKKNISTKKYLSLNEKFYFKL